MKLDSQTTLAFFQRRSLDRVREHLRDHPLFARDLEGEIDELRELEKLEIEDCRHRLLRPADDDLLLIRVFRYVANGKSGRPPCPQFAPFVAELADELNSPALEALAGVLQLIHRSARLSFSRALSDFREAERRLSRADIPAPYDSIIACLLAYAHGHAAQHCGDFRTAFQELGRAESLAASHGLWLSSSSRLAWGGLLSASGQFRSALEVFCDETMREALRLDADDISLVFAHNMAAESALGIGALDKADAELTAGRALLDLESFVMPTYEVYNSLYSARLAALRDEASARDQFEATIALAEELDVPQGILDTKLELIKHGLQHRDFDRALRQTGQLLKEAEDRGCIDARTRLLGFQARLCIDEFAPAQNLRKAYDDLIARVHLMNNPRLTFMAYADLYTFARRRLDAREQKFWLERLDGLKSLLERSCYDDLYETYVLERYREEIESSIEEFEYDDSEPGTPR